MLTRFIGLGLLLGSLVFAQTEPTNPYSFAQPLMQFSEAIKPFTTATVPRQPVPVDKPIDPRTYLLGPGDVLGYDLVYTENFSGEVAVGPSGDVLIPGIGLVNVNGVTLEEAARQVKRLVAEKIPDAIVHVTLANIRTFRLSVTGAVLQPGYLEVTPVDHLWDILQQAGGLHKFADGGQIQVRHEDGTEARYSVADYLITGDPAQNPTFLEGDAIVVPFRPDVLEDVRQFLTPNRTPVSVGGFVNLPGAYQFVYGYRVGDYIGIAGGPNENGTLRRGALYRGGKKLPLDLEAYVQPGDQIYLSENIRSRLLGKSSTMQTITALTSLYLTYLTRVKR